MGDTVAYLTHQLVLRGVYNLTKAEGDMIKMRKIEFQVSIWCMVVKQTTIPESSPADANPKAAR